MEKTIVNNFDINLTSIWDNIHNNLKNNNITYEQFENMTIEELGRYIVVISIQTFVYDEMNLCTRLGNNIQSHVKYEASGEKEFTNDNIDFLTIQNTVNLLSEKKRQINEILKNKSITINDFIQIYNKCLDEYKLIYITE